MLAVERQAKIVELTTKRGSVQVEELAQELKVSTMTIRRDLVKLEEESKLERCHGGAVARQEEPYAEKQISHKKEKEQLARKCLDYVKEGDTVFMDAGTTVYEVAKLIKDMKNLSVVTNDLEIAQLLKDSDIELFVCGGKVQKATGSMFERYATQMLEDFKFDVGFFGAACVNDQFEVMTPTQEKMWLKRHTPTQCAHSYLVVDASKFGKQAMTKINHLGNFDSVITNKRFNAKEQERLEQLKAVIISC